MTGSLNMIANGIGMFIEQAGADESMLNSNMHDHAARLHSCEIAADLIRKS